MSFNVTSLRKALIRVVPSARWIPEYRLPWLGGDAVAGITLAAYAIPISLAYAGLAGLPPQIGIYGYLLGGLGYALLGSSRQLAIGPTSAISLMIAATVGAMAVGDPVRYAQIATLAAFAVASLCLICWLLKLSVLIRLISDSILVGFKAGAGLTIIATQLPGFLGLAGGGHNFVERVINIVSQITDTRPIELAIGLVSLVLLLLGERFLPAKPVGLAVVALSIAVATVFALPAMGVTVTGPIAVGLPTFELPALRLRDVESLFSLAAGCLLLAYIEGVSAARAFAAKHGYALDPRQEFLGLGAANLVVALGHGYPVAGGLSQSAVNDSAGARTPLALVFCSISLALCLMFLADVLANLPKAVLAAIVLAAVYRLIDIPAMHYMWRVSRIDFYAAAVALVAVLLLGILQGILLAALASILMLLVRASYPYVAFLGRIPGTDRFSDIVRNPDNQLVPGVVVFRPEASLLYINADSVLEGVLDHVRRSRGVKLVVADLSASPYIDLAGSRMLHQLHDELALLSIRLRVVGAHAQLRDLLRADGLEPKVASLTLIDILDEKVAGGIPPSVPR